MAITKVTVAEQFFENVSTPEVPYVGSIHADRGQAWGENAFVTSAVPVFIALSALGNIFAQCFAMPRGKYA